MTAPDCTGLNLPHDSENFEASKTQEAVHPTSALTAVMGLYFIFGFLTCLNDILIPHLKSLFELTYTRAMFVQFCFFFAYFIGSLPFGRWVKRVGYKSGMVMGLCIAGSGAALFYPAAHWQSYGVFLSAFFTLALGITLLQVAANPYVTLLGPQDSAQSRLSLVQGFNSLGTTLAPLFGSAAILNAIPQFSLSQDSLSEAERMALQMAQADAIKGPYLGFSIVLFALALFIFLFRLPSVHRCEGERVSHSLRNLLKYRHLMLGVVGIFAYVGAEVSIGSFLVSYLSSPSVAGISPVKAGKYVTFYWGGAMIGRFIGSWLMTRIQPTRVLALNALAAVFLIVLTLLGSGNLAVFSILAVGLFNSIMFPTLFSLAIRGLGAATAEASGVLCMAIVGGALIPLLQGLFADQFGIRHAFVIPIFCYLYIVYYAISGYRSTKAHSNGS